MIWLVHLIYSAVGFALCYNYVILNYCIRFAVLPCVRLCLNSCYYFNTFVNIFFLYGKDRPTHFLKQLCIIMRMLLSDIH